MHQKTTMFKFLMFAVALLLATSQMSPVNGAIRLMIAGELTDLNRILIGKDIPTTYNVAVKIYDHSVGGTPLYVESFFTSYSQGITIDKGHFSVYLGSGTTTDDLKAVLSSSNNLFAEIIIDDNVLSRVPVTSSPSIITTTSSGKAAAVTANDILKNNVDDKNAGVLAAATNPNPVILANPRDTSVVPGDTAVFSIVASGENLNYQWYDDDGNIPGATLPLYRMPNVLIDENNTNLYCVVGNYLGEAVSSVAVLRVHQPYNRKMNVYSIGSSAHLRTNRSATLSMGSTIIGSSVAGKAQGSRFILVLK